MKYWLIVLLLAGLFVWGARPQPLRGWSMDIKRSDVALFQAVVHRVQGGESYYPAMNAELRARHYPTASVFNWRQPMIFALVAAHHTLMAGLLVFLVVAVEIGTVRTFRNAPEWITVLALILQIGALVTAFMAHGVYMLELWAGACLALSVLASMHKRIALAVLFGVAAVFAREIALPYALACIGMALWERRKAEAAGWCLGLTVWAGAYLWHVHHVLPFIQTGDGSHPSWVALGGWTFVVTTVHRCGWFFVLPRWVSALAAVAALGSLFAPIDRHVKVVVLVFIALFAVAGLPINSYWGVMTGPSWVLAMCYGVQVFTGSGLPTLSTVPDGVRTSDAPCHSG